MSHGFSRPYTDNTFASGVDSWFMAAPSTSLKHSDRTDKIIGVFYDVYNELGYGFLESTYAEAFALALTHEAQLLHYLRATEIEVGLLLNFGLRPQFRRLLFDNDRKKIRENPCKSVARVSA